MYRHESDCAEGRKQTPGVADDVVTANKLATHLGCTGPDKISNMNSVALSTPAHWSVERQIKYVAWAKNVVAALGDVLTPRCRPSSRFAADRADVAAALPHRGMGGGSRCDAAVG